VACEREQSLPGPAPALVSVPELPFPPNYALKYAKAHAAVTATSYNNDPDVLARLQRLEDLLQRVDAKVSATTPGYASHTTPHSLPQQLTPSDSHHTPIADDTEAAHNTDTRHLENIGTHNNEIKLAINLEYRVVHINYINYVEKLSRLRSPTSGQMIYLPQKFQAVAFLDVYHQHIEFLHHVTYTPHVYRTLDLVYEAIERHEQPSTGAVALLLSLFASAAALMFAIGPSDEVPGITISVDEAQVLSTVWARYAFDCLDSSRRLGLISMEDLQASITAFFLMYNLEGFSGRSRSGMAVALAIAKDLGLHRLDHPDTRQASYQKLDNVELEVRRRVWWHLTATDWCVQPTCISE
jgi:hypothetical protein